MLKDDLLNCARRHFALFFLAVLGVSAFPVCCSILNDTAKKMLLHYDAQQKASLGDITAAKRVLPTPQDNKSTGIATGIGKKMPPDGTKLFPTREEVEKQSARALPFRDEFSTFNMAFKRLCGMVRPIEGDRTIILPDGRLTQADAIPYMPVSGFSDAELALIRSFRDSCTAGTRFFAVMRPHNTVDKPEIYIPYTGVTISRGAVQAKQCRQLQELGITVFEMNEKFRQMIRPEEMKNYFYSSDHHWNVYGALLGGKLLAQFMNENFSTACDLRYFEPENFIAENFRRTFTGSLGKKLSTACMVNGKDDFTILHPPYPTRFTVRLPQLNSVRHGGFETMLTRRFIHYDSPRAWHYTAFLDKTQYFVRIHNHLCRRGKKILIINDSYARAMAPYLALQNKDIILMDPRYVSPEKIRQTISTEKPDFVIWMSFNDDWLEAAH